MGRSVRQRGDPRRVERLGHSFLERLWRETHIEGAKGYIVAHRGREQLIVGVLKDQPDLRSERSGLYGLAVQADRAVAGL